MLEIFNTQMRRVGVAPYVAEQTEREILNGVGSLSLTLPETIHANHLVARNYVKAGDAVYRIIDLGDTTADGKPAVSLECEHAIASLADNVMFQDHIVSGRSTREVIKYILSFQDKWVLGECDFEYYYEYSWSCENLLNALWSVPAPFTGKYKWTYDTTKLPWKLNLKKIDTEGKPEFYIIDKVNLLERTRQRSSADVVTRLYCLGYGEGVNQLDIREVNNDVPYLEAPKEVIERNGLVEAVWIDRRYEKAASLKASGQALLDEMMNPRVEYGATVADIYPVNSTDVFVPEVGKVVEIKSEHLKTYVTEVTRKLGDGVIELVLANKPADLVGSIADLAEKQRIEAAYAQGSTQLWGSPLQDNASPSDPLIYNLWIPEDTRIVNKVMVKVTLDAFRAYSKTTEAAGEVTTTSEADGGVSETTESGGGATKTTKGSGSLVTSSASSNKSESVSTSSTMAKDGELHSHTVGIKLISHSHSISSHTHDVTIPSHTHSFEVPDHTHDVSLPAHSHEITYGIYRASETPASAEITVNGVKVRSMDTSFEGDLTEFLAGEDGTIPRGQFIEIGIRPNTIAYVTISVAAQGFIQSRGGGRF